MFIRHAAEQLNAAGWNVVLLLDLPQEHFDRFVAEQIPLFSSPAKVRTFHVNDLIPAELQEPQPGFDIFRLKSRRFAAAIETLKSRERIDIVECFDYCGPGYDLSVRALFRKTPDQTSIVSRIHGSIEVLERVGGGLVRDRSRMSQWACERAALRLSDAVLTPSKTYFEEYYKPLYGLDPSKAHVSTPPKRAIGTVSEPPSSDQFSIVFVGRLFHLKGVDTLILAAAKLMRDTPHASFVVDLIGYDSTETPFPDAGPMYGDYLRSLIPADLIHRFRFRGHLSHGDILSALQSARFAVFPNRVESFCYALHEVFDAGVPIIVNDLPAFRDFFIHEVNCLTFNGTSTHLLDRMRRLLNDNELRRFISRPHPGTEQVPPDWYTSTQRALPTASTLQSGNPTCLIIVLVEDSKSLNSCAAYESLRRINNPESCEIFFASRCNPGLSGSCRILGETRSFADQHGSAIDPFSVRTRDSLLFLHQNDRFDPEWIDDCMRALARRDDVAFTGSWTTVDGTLRESSLDILPELVAFDHPGTLHRVVLHTTPGTHLTDLFDPTLGPLGHLGLIWRTCTERGNGVLLPHGRMHTASPTPLQPNDTHVKSLLLRHGGPFAENIAIFLALRDLETRSTVTPEMVASSTVSAPNITDHHTSFAIDRFAIAETLGGRTLLRMAFGKLIARIKNTIGL